ncbi:MAG: penicillin-binding protein activator LpoB [Steroidobacteraceae bacterium]
MQPRTLHRVYVRFANAIHVHPTGHCLRAPLRCVLVFSLLEPLLTGCVATSSLNPSGLPPTSFDPATTGPVAGVGIESHDIVSMTDQMMRDMLANPALTAVAKPPRVVIDSQYFRNEGSQAINRDLITDRLRVNLNRASQGRLTFLTRTNLEMANGERDLKRQGVTDVGTTGLTKAMMGADYRLTGVISTLDTRSPKTGIQQRYNQISFEIVDLESGAIVWSGLYEFARSAADDVVYR